MAHALPQYNDQHLQARRPTMPYGTPHSPNVANAPSMQCMQQMPQFHPQRHDAMALAKAQQQQFLPNHYGLQHAQSPSSQRHQPPQLQTQPSFSQFDPYAYGVQQSGYSPIDMRFPQPGFPASFGMPGAYADLGKCGVTT